MKELTWEELYKIANNLINPRKISPYIDAGKAACVIITSKGNMYTGINLETKCDLGICAERNAILNMITNGESKIVKLVCVMKDGRVGYPCGACRELLMQLDKESPNMDILVNLETEETVKLKELVPKWWGRKKFD